MALPPVLDEANLYKFRTKICERYVKQGKCEFADKCQYSHDLRWTRRPPWKYTYAPELCRELVFVTDGRGRTVAKSNCKQKRFCRFSHTKEEQMYHPKVYKTALCHQFEQNGWCDRYYCPFAHSEQELRHVDPPSETTRLFLTPAEQEAACPEIYLPSDRPHPRLRARFLALMDGIPTQSSLHLSLDPTMCNQSNSGRTRQPYTDFISSHTPHSVTSECSSPSTARLHPPLPSLHAVERASAALEGAYMGEQQSKRDDSKQHDTTAELRLQQQQHGTTANRDLASERKSQKTTTRLVQLLHAKQSTGGPSLTAAARDIGAARGRKPSGICAAHETNPERGIAAAQASAALTLSSSAPCTTTTDAFASYSLSSTSALGHQNPHQATQRAAAFANATGVAPAAPHQSRLPLATNTNSEQSQQPGARLLQHNHSSFETFFAGPFWPAYTAPDSADTVRASMSGYAGKGTGTTLSFSCAVPGGVVPGEPQHQSGWVGFSSKASSTQHRSEVPSPAQHQLEGAQREAALDCGLGAADRMKYLTTDICYWGDPIGRSRDDPSVLVYAGLCLGPDNSREVVAVKQLPVVVLNRVRDLWADINKFVDSANAPQLVGIKRALLLPGVAGEGTSLWVVTEKCRGSLVDLFPQGPLPAAFLRRAFPLTGLNGLLHLVLEAVHTLHLQSGSAHMRIHPGNIMVGAEGEVKLGDCAGKIRYLSILDLLHAGAQGATNAKALLQWILGTPRETCWMAPEFLASLAELDKKLSAVLWQCSASARDDTQTERELVDLASRSSWHPDFLRRVDAWCTGVTLFYLATSGLHPYGDVDDPATMVNILTDKKVNFDTVSNCPWLSDLLAGLLCSDPMRRLSLAQALRHPLFWYAEDIEKYLLDLAAALDDTSSRESAQLREALAYGSNWVGSLSSIPSPVPLLPLLLYYMAQLSASPQLLAAYPHHTASSFLMFLAYVAADRRLSLADRRLIVSECLMAHPAPFLHSVHLFFFPKVLAEDAGAAGVRNPVLNLSTSARPTALIDPQSRQTFAPKPVVIGSILASRPYCGMPKQDGCAAKLAGSLYATGANAAQLIAVQLPPTLGTVCGLTTDGGTATAAVGIVRSQTRASASRSKKEGTAITGANGAMRDGKESAKSATNCEARLRSAAATTKASSWAGGKDPATPGPHRRHSKHTPGVVHAARATETAAGRADKENTGELFTSNGKQLPAEGDSTSTALETPERKTSETLAGSGAMPKPSKSVSRCGADSKDKSPGDKNRGSAAIAMRGASGGGSPPGPAEPRRRSLAMSQLEGSSTNSTGTNNASLLQMPMAVSTVSTALSAATIDFCHGPSQVTEATAELFWTHHTHQPPSQVQGASGVMNHLHGLDILGSKGFDQTRTFGGDSTSGKRQDHVSSMGRLMGVTTDKVAQEEPRADACSIQ